MVSQVSVGCTLLETFLSFYTQLEGYKSVLTPYLPPRTLTMAIDLGPGMLSRSTDKA